MLHIEVRSLVIIIIIIICCLQLRRWAELMLIAPMSANTMGKIANGLCDNLLVSERILFSS